MVVIIDLGRRLSRIEHQSAVIYEMAAEQHAIYCLRSIGMTSIDGLSSEFYQCMNSGKHYSVWHMN